MDLFTWVHLSDLHFGQGRAADGFDQQTVLGALLRDLARQLENEERPRPNAVLITGDIAFKGAASEYERAEAWLEDLCRTLQLAKDAVFMVPGNHDVPRVGKDEWVLRLLVEELRERGRIDDALGHAGQREELMKRLANYNAFASRFSGMQTNAMGSWSAQPDCEGLALRLVGLNTSFLANDSRDKGRLQVGQAQGLAAFAGASQRPQELVIALSHHPLQGWMRDEGDLRAWLRNQAQIHLCGHVHEQHSAQVVSGSGGGLLTVVGGAGHGLGHGEGAPSHAYNLASLRADAEGRVSLWVWPRRWTRNHDFRVDVDNVPDGRFHAQHELKLRVATSPVASPESLAAGRRARLLGILMRLAPAQLDVLPTLLDVLPAVLPPSTAVPARRAAAVIELMRGREDVLEEALRGLEPGLFTA